MAYKVIILYRLYMPSYFLGTFTEYPYIILVTIFNRVFLCYIGSSMRHILIIQN